MWGLVSLVDTACPSLGCLCCEHWEQGELVSRSPLFHCQVPVARPGTQGSCEARSDQGS